jgi:hypothetical protein
MHFSVGSGFVVGMLKFANIAREKIIALVGNISWVFDK